ncbi:hypothetical protein Bca4012_097974 [Brassica carinata]|uniref:Uncharacterized protein n=1 Tax=Brassica oleracea var. oleracea TaxID=109376 RepID=A0A0D3CPN7_BRAOL
MGTLKKSPKSELWTEEVARGRLLLLSCATQVWKSELPSFLSRSTPSFVESKGVYVIFESASDLEAELSKLGIEKVDKPCKEAAQGRLMIWRRRLSKSPTYFLRLKVVDNNLNSVFARLRSITNQYNRLGMGSNTYPSESASLLGNHKDVSLADVPVEQLRKLMPLLLSSQRANIGIAVAPTTDAARGASDIHLTKP